MVDCGRSCKFEGCVKISPKLSLWYVLLTAFPIVLFLNSKCSMHILLQLIF